MLPRQHPSCADAIRGGRTGPHHKPHRPGCTFTVASALHAAMNTCMPGMHGGQLHACMGAAAHLREVGDVPPRPVRRRHGHQHRHGGKHLDHARRVCRRQAPQLLHRRPALSLSPRRCSRPRVQRRIQARLAPAKRAGCAGTHTHVAIRGACMGARMGVCTVHLQATVAGRPSRRGGVAP